MSNQVIRFCPLCDNKYYHHIEQEALIYYCRVCGNKDETISNERLCVLNIDYDNKETKPIEYIINKYTKFDPTLPHIFVPCPNEQCKSHKQDKEGEKHTDAIFIRYDESNMKHLYICTLCDHIWKTNET
jgi:DNA-directed RNA polymerase subunit M/transcription elongation factor TFIIS